MQTLRIDRAGFLKGFACFWGIQLAISGLISIVQIIWPQANLRTVFMHEPIYAWIILLILFLVELVLYIEFFMLSARRLHDLGQSGLVTLLFFIPLVNIIFLIYIAAAPGQKEINQYGPPPNSRKLKYILGFRV